MPTKIPQNDAPQDDALQDDIDDYMSMPIVEPVQKLFETSAQRRQRKQREAEARSRPPPASEKPVQEPEPIAPTSKGFRMLSALGYKAGSTLGAKGNPNALLQPIGVEVKEDKGGIGHENEKKRKIREEWEKVERSEKMLKAEAGDYRVRVAKEREERRLEGRWWDAMKVLEGLEEDQTGDERADEPHKEIEDGAETIKTSGRRKKLVRNVNLLYRPLIQDRVDKERGRRARHDLNQSLSRAANYDEEDDQDKQAFGDEEEELEETDAELTDYLALEPADRLTKVVMELRENWRYCYWCKYRYEDDKMEGCPGTDEDSHG